MSASPGQGKTLFIDRNSGGRSFKELVRARSVPFILHDEILPQNAPDEAWLQAIERENYIGITGDKQITRQRRFIDLLHRSRAYVFVLLDLNGRSAEQKAELIASLYERIQKKAMESAPPRLWRIGQDEIFRELNIPQVYARMFKRA